MNRPEDMVCQMADSLARHCMVSERRDQKGAQVNRWGFYSARHAAINGSGGSVRTRTFRTEKGHLVEVTHVSTTPKPAAYLWDDAVPVGRLDLTPMGAQPGLAR